MAGVITDKLNDRQKEAVLSTQGPLLILAGAGSGKTRVITNRIAYLIEEKGVNANEIMAITFTNKAAAEMKERIEEQVGEKCAGAWISTFHSACLRILHMYGHLIGYDDGLTIYDRDDSLSVIKRICKDMQIDTKKFKEKGFLNKISSLKDELISAADYEAEASDVYERKSAEVYLAYEKELKKNNAVDFDDLIFKTVDLFRKEPEILERFQERFKYISVDEYQDTNTAQFELVRLLSGKYKNICVVGDDDQSIYKFRGANIENILSFEKYFPDAKVIRLEQNYRSTGNILAAANAVISNNTGRKEKTLWTQKGDGAKIKLFHTDNPYVESDKIIARIREYLRQGYALNDCACLYRTNAQSRSLEEAFIRANIPYKIVGGVNFYQRKEIKDVLAYLKTVNNARDDVAVQRIINVPKRGIGAATVTAVSGLAQERGINFYSALDSAVIEGTFGRSGERLRAFRDLIEDLKADLEKESLSGFLQDVLLKTGYTAELKLENTEESKGRLENIEELANKLKGYEEGADNPTLSGFLEEVSLVADIDSWDGAEDYVSLITIHSAKGLEFPNVFLCGMEDGLFPMNAAICSDDPGDLEEERRLCYVGITRAKENLVLTAARIRMVRGETMPSIISRFVREIPAYLIEPDRNNIRDDPKYETSASGAASFRKSPGRAAFDSKPYAAAGPYASSKAYSSKSGAASGAYQPTPEKKQFEVKNRTELGYAVGDRVRQMKYGEGTVLAIDSGGRDYEITVDFDDFGVKKMFAGFAKLKKVL